MQLLGELLPTMILTQSPLSPQFSSTFLELKKGKNNFVLGGSFFFL